MEVQLFISVKTGGKNDKMHIILNSNPAIHLNLYVTMKEQNINKHIRVEYLCV